MDTNYAWTTKDLLQTVFAFLQACSVGVAILIYLHQSGKLRASERQANRARLTEAYMGWHRAILGNDKNTILSGKMMRRGHALVRDEYEDISEERAREIHIFCLLLNTLFLEWNYRITYDRKVDGNFQALNATIDNILTGMVINSDRHYSQMVANLRKVFPDFPDDFTNLIEGRVEIIRQRHRTATGPDSTRELP
jgi:hypothetical protein